MEALVGSETSEIGNSEVKTNLFTSLKSKENRKPLRKLYAYSIFLVILPIVTFFITRDYLVRKLELEQKRWDLVSGLAAILVTNIVIGMYIVDAFSEPVDDNNNKKKKISYILYSIYIYVIRFQGQGGGEAILTSFHGRPQSNQTTWSRVSVESYSKLRRNFSGS
mmetsp:Transcript_30774/g.37977  ORF Transcript_30774/g.37977 Transcript_30774/m.37977 type:complete len:165 (+) Transcript_30774:63-557(+)